MSRHDKAQTILILLWAGLVLGISFLEAPIKFTTPSLTREVALDVGQTVFQALNHVEWVLCAGLAAFTLFYQNPRHHIIAFALILLCLFSQSFWLLPELKARATLIIGGTEPPSSYVHLLYIILDILKIGILLTLGYKKLPNF